MAAMIAINCSPVHDWCGVAIAEEQGTYPPLRRPRVFLGSQGLAMEEVKHDLTLPLGKVGVSRVVRVCRTTIIWSHLPHGKAAECGGLPVNTN